MALKEQVQSLRETMIKNKKAQSKQIVLNQLQIKVNFIDGAGCPLKLYFN